MDVARLLLGADAGKAKKEKFATAKIEALLREVKLTPIAVHSSLANECS